MFTTLIVFQVLIAAGLIAIVLVQRGPGATMGAAFGSGASGTVFGSRGAGNFLTRTTSWLALGFMGISLALAVIATSVGSGDGSDSGLFGSMPEQQEQVEESDEGAAAIESVIDDLDNAPAGSADDTSQSDEAVAEDAVTEDPVTEEPVPEEDDDLPDPPPGS